MWFYMFQIVFLKCCPQCDL